MIVTKQMHVWITTEFGSGSNQRLMREYLTPAPIRTLRKQTESRPTPAYAGTREKRAISLIASEATGFFFDVELTDGGRRQARLLPMAEPPIKARSGPRRCSFRARHDAPEPPATIRSFSF